MMDSDFQDEAMRPGPNSWRLWRQPVLFLLGPGLATLAISLILQHWPPAYPVPSQGAALGPAFVAIVLGAGALGVFLSGSVGFPGAPGAAGGWRRLLVWALGAGIAFGAVAVAADAAWGVSDSVARQLGLRSIHVAFPASLGVYAAFAVAGECFYRLAPIPIAMWLVGRVSRGPRTTAATFWVLAVLTSLVEPAQQLSIALANPTGGAALGLAIFGVNLEEAYLFRRFGWPAPLATRLAFYLVWHVLAPLGHA